ncbi:MAG: hypothetical protein HC892_00450 [Saprospiraceae bacterium]|nr:hypothetical protein [Saprospiraceae bacterium]
MNQILSIILIVGCVNISFGQPVVLQNKLYLIDNKVYIPKILEERAALINYFNADKEYVEENNEYVLMFSVSKKRRKLEHWARI